MLRRLLFVVDGRHPEVSAQSLLHQLAEGDGAVEGFGAGLLIGVGTHPGVDTLVVWVARAAGSFHRCKYNAVHTATDTRFSVTCQVLNSVVA